MDPNLFHIDWAQLAEVLAAVVVLSFMVAPAWVSVANAVRQFYNYRMRDAVYGTAWDDTVVITGDARGNFRVRTLGPDGTS